MKTKKMLSVILCIVCAVLFSSNAMASNTEQIAKDKLEEALKEAKKFETDNKMMDPFEYCYFAFLDDFEAPDDVFFKFLGEFIDVAKEMRETNILNLQECKEEKIFVANKIQGGWNIIFGSGTEHEWNVNCTDYRILTQDLELPVWYIDVTFDETKRFVVEYDTETGKTKAKTENISDLMFVGQTQHGDTFVIVSKGEKQVLPLKIMPE